MVGVSVCLSLVATLGEGAGAGLEEKWAGAVMRRCPGSEQAVGKGLDLS